MPPKLDRADADAAAERLLSGYREQGEARHAAHGGGRSRARGRRRGAVRWIAWLAIVVLAAALGAWLGSLRGQTGAGAAVMALLGVVLGAFATRR